MRVTKKHKELKFNQAIDLLNDIVKIKLSPVSMEEIGVFAMREIKKGDKLYADAVPLAFDLPYSKFHRLRPEISKLLVSQWAEIVNGAPFLYPVTKMTAFIRHSDTPNYDAKVDKVLRKIKLGEEITV